MIEHTQFQPILFKKIKPIQVIDKVIEVDVAPIIKTLSTSSNIVIKVF